jgi:DNA end-binding protein Ku
MKALEDTESVGIGKLTLHQRDYTVFLRAHEHDLRLHTMYFANEIRRLPDFGVVEAVNLKPQEVKLAEQLIGTLIEHFKQKQYHGEFQERLHELIEAKRQGRSVEIEETTRRAPVIENDDSIEKEPRRELSAEKKTKTPKVRKASLARNASLWVSKTSL